MNLARPLKLLPLALSVLLLAGCGEKSADSDTPRTTSQSLTLLLDYFPNADHAGLYAALGTGAFDRAGLKVTPRTPSDPSAPLKLLAAGKADLAISYQPELMLARAKGQKLQAIAALVQKPLTALISVGDKPITAAAQLRGSKVGTAGIPYQSAYLKTILASADVPTTSVREVNVGFNLTPAMLSGRVGATLGSFWNYEGVDLKRRGRKPSILRMEDLGVPEYNELIVVAREDTVRDSGPVLRRFLQALADGHRALRADATAGLKPLLAANPDLERGLQTAVIAATMPVFFPEDDSRSFGWMDPGVWQRYAVWMQKEKLIANATVGARAFTNEFLPGEGLGDGDSEAP